ncbi:unnamed protein product [Clonostachys rhizophaga]|uniref:Aminoglycoside phosphotransferase domain-containing protein n=1 Tax=Clonostachys rhizophaga TaxID=160324 RepID=A0A9N9YGS7_9HYPO|nr:unnamed protein product [Clonostachys rhizophaga]
MMCERVQTSLSKPADALATWEDEGETFYVRERTPDDITAEGDAQFGRVYVAGVSAAVWCIGQCFFKVHAWREGMELESNNIQFVKDKAPEVPVPDVIYSWIDHDINRNFLITKRVSGQTLDQAWPRLSLSQRTQVAKDIANYIVKLALNTAPSFQTINGYGVREPWLQDKPPTQHPLWLPRLLGPLSVQEMQAYMIKISKEPPPSVSLLFHFYHADLGPKNIIVLEDGKVSGIIDWESAAYYPRFWVATKTSLGAFKLECETDNQQLWGQLLGQALELHGYKRLDIEFQNWYKGMA